MDRGRLAGISFFRGLPDSELDAVVRIASEREFAAGSSLTDEGEFGHCLFVIEAGSAEVSINGTSVDSIGPGAVVGEVAVLASGRRTASVVATSPMTVIAFFKPDVWALESEAPEVGGRLRAALDKHVGAGSPG
jgi:CRP-like cAMP-binding protein